MNSREGGRAGGLEAVCTQPGCLALQPAAAAAAPTRQLLPSALPFMVHEVPAARAPSGEASRGGMRENTWMVPKRWGAQPVPAEPGAASPRGLSYPSVNPKGLQTAPSPLAPGWGIPLPLGGGGKSCRGLIQSPAGPRAQPRRSHGLRGRRLDHGVSRCHHRVPCSTSRPGSERRPPSRGRSVGHPLSRPSPARPPRRDGVFYQRTLRSCSAARQNTICYHWKFSIPAEAAQNKHNRFPAGAGPGSQSTPGAGDAPR